MPAYNISKVSNFIFEILISSNIKTKNKDKVATTKFCNNAIKKGKSNLLTSLPI